MTIYLAANKEYIITANNLAGSLKRDLSCKISSNWHEPKHITNPEKTIKAICNADLVICFGITAGKEKWLEVGIAYGYYKTIIALTSATFKDETDRLLDWILMKRVSTYQELINLIQDEIKI